MKRLIYQRLKEWKEGFPRKPLILRGARQVGKTHVIRQLGSTFESFIEINFEYSPSFTKIFEEDLDPERIIREISIMKKKVISSRKTLLFFDEIQACPRAINSLRYFYEKMPDLHVISAGSLLEFAHELIGMPVGRVQSLYMYPMSFLEYLAADNEHLLIEEILQKNKFSEPIHQKVLKHLGIYLALGGMPEVVQCWSSKKDPISCSKIHATLTETYRQDFQKYAKKSQLKYLSLLFENIPLQLGEKFKFSKVGEYRKRELEPSVDLLLTANIFQKVMHTSAQGIPIGAGSNPERFKLLFIDVGLTQSILDLDLSSWFIQPEIEILNKGKIVEAFVGQELLAYANSDKKHQLYYWQRESRNSSAEVDYLIQKDNDIIPIEVKSGKTAKAKSMHFFLDSHPHTKLGIKVSIQNHYQTTRIRNLPLYSIALLSSNLEPFHFLIKK